MSMAIARSVLARAARGRHTAFQPLVPARAALEPPLPSAGWMMQRNTTANTVGKRFLSGKERRRDSILDKLPDFEKYVPLTSVIALCAFTCGVCTIVPYIIDNLKGLEDNDKARGKEGPEKSRR